MSDEVLFGKDSVAEKLVAAQRERARDRGHFSQYGMRDDPRGGGAVEGENPGNGENARRFGAGGDVSSYGNRAGGSPAGHVQGTDDAINTSADPHERPGLSR